MKPIFITVDTEGDALWSNSKAEDIQTENVLWIPRFQELCEKYGFVPIWLTDYEIICDNRFVKYIKEKNEKGLCEVGIHVHAKNTPPIHKLENEENAGGAYLIEYPKEIMRDKFLYLKNLIEDTLNCKVITHRAGRWTLNKDYIDLMIESGIQYDCSVTPGISWKKCVGCTPNSQGSDYSDFVNERQEWKHSTLEGEKITEYPMSIVQCKRVIRPAKLTWRNIAKSIYHYIKRAPLWLRPNTSNNLNEMKYVLDHAMREDNEYVEFMIHSSELMPGGGPHNDTAEQIEELFRIMDQLFAYAHELGFRGYTFKQWEETIKR